MVCNRDFVRFVTEELLPWAGVSAERNMMVAGGSSVGGLAAAFAAVERPDIFGAVLSMSGSFQRGPLGGEPGYLMSRLAEQRPLPIRWYLDAGVLELRVVEGRESNLHANRHLRDVLVAKGYEVHHREFPGSHDNLWWRETMADGLVALVGRQT
jgi:enterochelin esterase family protein